MIGDWFCMLMAGDFEKLFKSIGCFILGIILGTVFFMSILIAFARYR